MHVTQFLFFLLLITRKDNTMTLVLVDNIVSFVFLCIALVCIICAIVGFVKRRIDRRHDLSAALAMSENPDTIYVIDHVQVSSNFDFKSYYIQHKHHILVFTIPDENTVVILSV